MNSLVVEIADVTAKERGLLEQCRDFLSTLAAMQVMRLAWPAKALAIFAFVIQTNSHLTSPLSCSLVISC